MLLWLCFIASQGLKSDSDICLQELTAAAFLVTKFKTCWTSDECILKCGKNCTVVFIVVIDENLVFKVLKPYLYILTSCMQLHGSCIKEVQTNLFFLCKCGQRLFCLFLLLNIIACHLVCVMPQAPSSVWWRVCLATSSVSLCCSILTTLLSIHPPWTNICNIWKWCLVNSIRKAWRYSCFHPHLLWWAPRVGTAVMGHRCCLGARFSLPIGPIAVDGVWDAEISLRRWMCPCG